VLTRHCPTPTELPGCQSVSSWLEAAILIHAAAADLLLQGLREWQMSRQLPSAAGLIVPFCTFFQEKTGLCYALSLYGGCSLEETMASAQWQGQHSDLASRVRFMQHVMTDIIISLDSNMRLPDGTRLVSTVLSVVFKVPPD
jgi:hypothetical protein